MENHKGSAFKQVVCSVFCEIFKNTFFTEHFRDCKIFKNSFFTEQFSDSSWFLGVSLQRML